MAQRFIIDININGAETQKDFEKKPEQSKDPKKQILSQAKDKKAITPPVKEQVKETPKIKTPNQYFQELKAQTPSLMVGDLVIQQTVGALIDYRKHTSGDAYADAQLDNGVKLVRYGAAIAGSGFNPIVIATIAATEIIQGISQGAKYDYDRKLERQQITNMQIVAGNISYGRNRGSV